MWCPTIWEACLLLLILFTTIRGFLKYYYEFWLRQQVPQIRPTWLLGNMGSLLRMDKSPAHFIEELYNDPQAVGEAFVGIHIFHKPAILVRHPDLIKRVLMKDFSKFCNRYSNADAKVDPLGSLNIFLLKNPAWKKVRLRLSPFFSTGKIKHMFHLIEEVGHNLDAYLLQHPIENVQKQSFILELKEFCAQYTTDVIATTAYGVQANSFYNPEGDFRRNGRKVFRFSLQRGICFIIIFFLPQLVPYLRVKVVPAEVTTFLRSTINYVMREREASGKTRNDLIDILIEFKNWSKKHSAELGFEFDGDLLVAQASLFFTAGFETSSATMSFALYELAKHSDVQQRLRDEIKNALIESGSEITQQMLDSLEYMQMIISEVLRLYPPLPFLDRECTVVADEKYSLKPFHYYEMPRGMPIYIPVYGLHRDPKYYPNPETFDPERFSSTNKKNLIPYTYMPFGLGPHACIGERFAYIQMKIGLVNFLRNHYVSTCDKTQAEMKLDPKSIVVQAAGGIYLNIVRDPLNI